MSTNTREAQELVHLFQYVVDTGTEVLCSFAIKRLLPKYNESFTQFLDDKKHEIFHIWRPKILCCACSPVGCSLHIRRSGQMENCIFSKIYDKTDRVNTGHIIRRYGNVVQMCLHEYVTRNISINELDIGVLSFLLRNFGCLSPKETTALDTITSTRSKIFNAYSTNCYPIAVLNNVWTELETALNDLAEPSYKGVIQREMKYLRMVDLQNDKTSSENVPRTNPYTASLNQIPTTTTSTKVRVRFQDGKRDYSNVSDLSEEPPRKCKKEFINEEINFTKIGMIVLNILADASYDLLKKDKPNIRQRSDCDVSYLYREHRKLNKYIPSNSWGGTWQTINNTDIAIGDDIERIRLTRNELQHSHIFKLENTRFNELCIILSDLLKRLDNINKPTNLYIHGLIEILAKTISAEEVKFIEHEIGIFIEVEIENQTNVQHQ